MRMHILSCHDERTGEHPHVHAHACVDAICIIKAGARTLAASVAR